MDSFDIFEIENIYTNELLIKLYKETLKIIKNMSDILLIEDGYLEHLLLNSIEFLAIIFKKKFILFFF